MFYYLKKEKIANLLLILFSIVEVSVNYIVLDDIYINLIRAMAGLLCCFYALFHTDYYTRYQAIRYGLFFSLLLILSILSNGNARYANILWIWSYLGVALLVFNHYIYIITAKIILLFYTIVFCIGSFFNKVEASELFSTGSANGVSVLFLYAVSLYYVVIYKDRKQSPISYIPIALLAFFSVWAANRSGLLTAGIMFSFAIINNIVLGNRSNKLRNILILFVVSLLSFFIVENYLGLYSQNMINKYDRYGNESVRTEIWFEYFIACMNHTEYLMFGAPASDSSIYHYNFYDGNTHNAFFMLHAKYGIIGLVFIILNIVHFIINRLSSKDFYLITILLGIITRGMFDWTAFPGLHDIFFWLVIFYNCLRNRINN